MIKLTKRLEDIAMMVKPCNIIADIGTDHGYIPIYLVGNKIASFAIASDVRKGPVATAKNNVLHEKLQDKIKVIEADGLINIPSVNYVIIAGMGGLLIKDILEKKTNEHDYYVLEPNNNVYPLRCYLEDNNYHIIDEKISYDNKKYYEIIKVVKKDKKQELTYLERKFGPINLINKDKLFISKWLEILNRYKSILIDFKGNEDERNKILTEIKEIESIL